jgi:hypothetical protein
MDILGTIKAKACVVLVSVAEERTSKEKNEA